MQPDEKPTPDETALAAAARAGDAEAFAELVRDARPKLMGFLHRMVGHPDEVDEIAQETLIRAWEKIGAFRGEARFSTWLIAIAGRIAVDRMRKAKRWRAEAQVAYANMCAASPDLSGEVMAAYEDPAFAYEVREHIAYCFTCVGRSLPPDELAALVLRDVTGLSAREAANALGISDSVLRHRLSAARQSMTDKFDGLCALVNKTGICHQCKGLRALAREDRKGSPLPDIAGFAERCAMVREAPPDGAMAPLHDLFWRRTAEMEEAGLGSPEPDSRCGEDDDGKEDTSATAGPPADEPDRGRL
ncbi:RNA polymerase sigma factor [Oricola sp.]|uniref:RNA polymerase sigma factor n=1 Tax=Oricola sp. TaxID=1979950 RepID=UPI003BACA444